MNPWTTSFFISLRERKILRIAATYLVIGFALVEASEILFPRVQFSTNSVDILLACLLFLFPLVLLLAWVFGKSESGTQVSAVIPTIALLVITLPAAWLGIRVLQSSEPITIEDELPLIVLMDSHHPARVYDH